MSTIADSVSVHRAPPSRAVSVAVVLLSAPALLWGIVLLVGVTAKEPGLGGLAGSDTAAALGLASLIGLIGAAGAAIVGRISAGRPATDVRSERTGTSERGARLAPRGPAALIAATALAGGVLIAAVAGQLLPGMADDGVGTSVVTEQPVTPVAPVEQSESESPFGFGNHTDH